MYECICGKWTLKTEKHTMAGAFRNKYLKKTLVAVKLKGTCGR